MQKRLFVGNLSFDTTETSLRSHFEDGGRKVSTCQLMVDRDTGR
jgi:RNA recognition motif-containing protein